MKKIIVICSVLFVVSIVGVAAVVLPIVAKTKEAALKLAAEQQRKAEESEKTPAESVPAQNETTELSPTKMDPSTLVDAIRGKRVHLEGNAPGMRKYQIWLQITEENQLTIAGPRRQLIFTFHLKGHSLFAVAPNGGATEFRFTKSKLTPGDTFQLVDHKRDVDLQAILSSTDNSTELNSKPGVILKIEEAQPLEKQPAEKNSPN